MKRILLILLMIGGIAYGQCPVVTGVTVTNLTSTTGKVSYTAAAGATLYYWTIYQAGSVTPAAGSTTTSTTFNFTGLTKSTSYKVYVRTQCGAVFSATSDSASFSTLSDGATYTPLAAQGYQMKYAKVDSGFNLPLHDTILLRGIDQAGAQVYKPGSGVFVYNGSYWQGISGGTGTIIITDSSRGIDSITFNGYMECIYLHDSITPRCWQLNTFFDDVRLSDDSTLYEFYNGDSLVKTVPSGIKNVGAVWPLSYDGVDLTTSKPFNDSLYLSSLVKHSDSLFSKKLTGDSVFVGLMSGGGSSGVDSLRGHDSLIIVYNHVGTIDTLVLRGSGSSGTGVSKYTTNGYGIFVDSTSSLYTVKADSATLSLKYLRRADSTGNTGYAQIWKQNNALTTVSTPNDTTIRFSTFGGTNYDVNVSLTDNWTKLGSDIYRATGRVGIGASTAPTSLLSLSAASSVSGLAMPDSIGLLIKNTTTGAGTASPGLILAANGRNTTSSTDVPSRIRFRAFGNSGTSNTLPGLAIEASLDGGTTYSTFVNFSQTSGLIQIGGANLGPSTTVTNLTTTNLSYSSAAGGNTTSTSNVGPSGVQAGNTFAILKWTGQTQNSSSTTNTSRIGGVILTPTINGSGTNTSIINGFYFGPTSVNTAGNIIRSFQSTTGDIISTGTGRMVVGDAAGDTTPVASAKVDIRSTTQGILIPTMTTSQRTAISSPATGLLVYDTDLKRVCEYDGASWKTPEYTSTGTAAPATTPLAVGDKFVDTTNKKIYFATGTSSSADWTIVN